MEENVIADGLVPVLARVQRTARDKRRDPQVAGASAIEVECGGDAELGKRLGGKGTAQSGQRSLPGVTEGPAGAPVPDEEGSGTGFLVVEAVDQIVIFYQKGSGLH